MAIKQIILIKSIISIHFVLVFSVLSLHAQTKGNSQEFNYSNSDSFENGEYTSDFELHISTYLKENMESPQDLLKLIGGELVLCDIPEDDGVRWENLGPFDSKNDRQMNQGRIEAISVNRYNENDILVGGHNGGVWRTLDGGVTWRNTTDDEGLSVVGFHEIIRHPKNQKVVYAATGVALNQWNNGSRGYGIGIVMSVDGGETWTETGHSPPYGGWHSGTADIVIDPRSTFDSTILYTINATTLFRYTGLMEAKGQWQEIYSDKSHHTGPAIFGDVTNHDLEIDRWGNVFLCNALGVYYYVSGGTTIEKLTSIKIPDERSDRVFCNGDTIQNPVKVLFDLEINKQGHLALLANYYYVHPVMDKCKVKTRPYYYCTSIDGGKSWTEPINLKTGGYAFPNLAVNQYNTDIFYFEGSGRHVRKSINGGQTNKKLKTNRNHVDVRHLKLTKSTIGDSIGIEDEVYVGNDGGIAKLDGNEFWRDITGVGICNTNYFGLGITDANSEYIFTGAQDGSLNFYDNGEWYTTSPGGDNGDCLIDPRDESIVYQSANGTFRPGVMDGKKWRGRGGKSLVKGVGLFPVLMNPNNPDEVFAGGNEVHVSSDNGRTWQEIQHVEAPKRINRLAMSEANSNVLYYVNHGYYWDKKSPAVADHNQGGIFKAIRDLNGTWKVENISSNLYDKCIGERNCGLPQILSAVTVDPTNENRLFVTMSGFKSGKKVFQSNDGGNSWQNISQCLPNLPATCIVYEKNSNDGIYVGTDYGVFYKNADLEDWVIYGSGGPNSMITDMHINYQSRQLIVSSMGRGLWRAPLFPK